MNNIDKIRTTVPMSAVMPKTAMDGCCPFCGKFGAFLVSVERGFYDCSDCGETGDVIAAFMKLEGVGVQSAIARLMERAGCRS